jgi:hypothetical protein
LLIGGKDKESIFGKGRVARKFFIGGKAKHAHITGVSVILPFTPSSLIYKQLFVVAHILRKSNFM